MKNIKLLIMHGYDNLENTELSKVVLASESEYLLQNFIIEMKIKHSEHQTQGIYYTIEEVAFC